MKTKRELIDSIIQTDYYSIIGTSFYKGFLNRLLRMDEQEFIDTMKNDFGFNLQPIIKNHYILTL
jgi:hypothetical protein